MSDTKPTQKQLIKMLVKAIGSTSSIEIIESLSPLTPWFLNNISILRMLSPGTWKCKYSEYDVDYMWEDTHIFLTIENNNSSVTVHFTIPFNCAHPDELVPELDKLKLVSMVCYD